jgi:hypothetical protein
VKTASIVSIIAALAVGACSAAPPPAPVVLSQPTDTPAPTSDPGTPYRTFTAHLVTATTGFAAIGGRIAADLRAGKRTAAKADGTKLRSLTVAELAWLDRHQPAYCYSGIWYQWQAAMYAAQGAAAALAHGKFGEFNVQLADANGSASDVAAWLGAGTAQCP